MAGHTETTVAGHTETTGDGRTETPLLLVAGRTETTFQTWPAIPKPWGLWLVPYSHVMLAASFRATGSPESGGGPDMPLGCSPSRPLHPLWLHRCIVINIMSMMMTTMKQPTSYGRSDGQQPEAPAQHCRHLCAAGCQVGGSRAGEGPSLSLSFPEA